MFLMFKKPKKFFNFSLALKVDNMVIYKLNNFLIFVTFSFTHRLCSFSSFFFIVDFCTLHVELQWIYRKTDQKVFFQAWRWFTDSKTFLSLLFLTANRQSKQGVLLLRFYIYICLWLLTYLCVAASELTNLFWYRFMYCLWYITLEFFLVNCV